MSAIGDSAWLVPLPLPCFLACLLPRSVSEENRLAITPIDRLEHMPDLKQRTVCTRTIQHGWYDVSVLGSSLSQRRETLLYDALVSGRPQLSHPFPLGSLRVISHLQDLDRRLRLLHEIVDSHDSPPPLLHLGLKAHRGMRDLPLEPA